MGTRCGSFRAAKCRFVLALPRDSCRSNLPGFAWRHDIRSHRAHILAYSPFGLESATRSGRVIPLEARACRRSPRPLGLAKRQTRRRRPRAWAGSLTCVDDIIGTRRFTSGRPVHTRTPLALATVWGRRRLLPPRLPALLAAFPGLQPPDYLGEAKQTTTTDYRC